MSRLLFVVAVALLACCATGTAALAQSSKIFPYTYHVRDLENGLRVIVVPTDYPNIVSLQIPVSTGSRNEVEPGKSGFAHFFEHMMFRGTETYPADVYGRILQNAGADQNAYTTDDYTNYHITFSRDDLETVIKLEADRFQHLKYSVEDFKTESRAVLGEYNKNSANPIEKLFERQRDLAFKAHTYKHTTMGFLKDVEDMPNQFDYSLTFFDRYYRPEKTTIILAGDLQPDVVFRLVDRYWSGWKRGSFDAAIPEEPSPDGPKNEHIVWETETLPWVTVAFRGPAFSETHPDMPAMDVIANLAFSSSSPLYKKLVLTEQKVQELFAYFPYQKDPYLLTVGAQVNDPADMAYVRDQIQQTLADLRTELVSKRKLEEIKSNVRYGFANSMDNSETIASVLPQFIALTRDPETINRYYSLFDTVTPEVVRDMANRYFVDQGMVVVTLAPGEVPAGVKESGSVDQRAEQALAAAAPVESVLMKNEAPLINFRLLFRTGSADDPEGKEGLAELTARMVTQGGSTDLPYDEIQKALFPLAAGFDAQVDKEMTVFTGRTHLDNLNAYYDVVSGQLFEPGWRTEDFERIKTQLINDIRVSLRGNNDEELGKEVLYEVIYDGHSYGHLNFGHVNAIESLTLDDVKQFYHTYYTRDRLVLGMAGNLPESFQQRIQRDLSRLPASGAPLIDVGAPEIVPGRHVTLIDKDTRAAAISFGFPIDVTRADKDFAALWVIQSFLGEHRSSNSYLYQRIREARGMNYGDYAYIEYFPRGMFQFHPDPNLGRRQQIFQVWIRPVQPENTHFALRTAVYELDRLIKNGLSRETFESTRNYLLKFANVLTKSQDRQLGYALDSRYYGTRPYDEWVRESLGQLTLTDVNRVLRRVLQTKNMQIVIVADDADTLKARLAADGPSPITYDAPKPKEIVREDRVIQNYKLGLKAENIRIVPVDRVFE